MKVGKILNEEESLKKFWDGAESYVNNMGFDYCVCPHVDRSQKITGVLLTKNAIGWRNHHIENSYIKYDLVRKTALSKKILVWNAVNEKDKNIRKVFSERRDYGMKSGITIPILNKFSNLTSWVSLATQNSEKDFSSIINDPFFSEKVYDIHIKTISYKLSDMTGIEFNFCYAIVLSQYTRHINSISKKTGLLVDDLKKLFGDLYLSCNEVDFSYWDIQKNSVNGLKTLFDSLEDNSYLICKFSKRQLDCINLIKKGLTVKRGAKELGISPRTYEGYAKDIRQKLNCSTQRELMFKLSNYNVH
jgi:DNA-binding CsgD family transcriptional regulator